jgi:hypothetical protein
MRPLMLFALPASRVMSDPGCRAFRRSVDVRAYQTYRLAQEYVPADTAK